MDTHSIREKIAPTLAQYGVTYAGVFGSFARGTATEESDIDLLIELTEPIGVFRLVGLKYALEAILGRSVDIAVKDSIHPLIAPYIAMDLIPLYEV